MRERRLGTARGLYGVRHGRERNRRFLRRRPTQQGSPAMITMRVARLLAQPGLSDAGFAVDQHHAAFTRTGARQDQVELIKEIISADEGDSQLGHAQPPAIPTPSV